MATIGLVKLPPMVTLTSNTDISASLSGDPTIRVQEKGSLWASTGSESSQWSVALPCELSDALSICNMYYNLLS